MASADFNAQAWGEGLEVHFEQVYQTQMQGLPIVNANLHVRLACLKEVRQGIYLGALVTPWFLNLVLKMIARSDTEETWIDRHAQLYPAMGVGQKVELKFPSGNYEFIVNHQAELGYFYTCSLVSDMHTLESQAVAETMAEQCVHLVFDSAAKEPNLFRPKDVPTGKESISESTQKPSQVDMGEKADTMSKLPDQARSRRDFLRLNRT